MAEPRKITIKLRPVGAKPAPAAPKPEAAPAAPSAEATPPAPAPSAPAPAEPAPAPAAEVPVAEQAKRQTSRIELPPEITQQPMNAEAAEAPTIALKPVSETAKPAPADNSQAAKSKTARIALDSVLGGIQTNTPLANTTQKTIKLKRATPAAPKAAASAPMSAVAGEEKTIKLKRPATLTLKKDAPPPSPTGDDLETLESLDEADLAPTPMPVAPPAQESAGAKAFTIVSVVAAALAIIVTLVLCGVMQKQAFSPKGLKPDANTPYAIPIEVLF